MNEADLDLEPVQRLIVSGRLDEAANLLQRIWHRDRSDPRPLLLLARLESGRGRPAEARSAARKVLEFDSANRAARLIVVETSSEQGQKTEAAEAAREWVHALPEDWFGWVTLSRAIDNWTMAPEGLAAAEHATHLAVEEPEAHVAFADALLRRRQTRRALRELRTAQRLAPGNGQIEQAIAVAQAEASPAASVARLLPLAMRDPTDRLVAANLRAAIGRVVHRIQLVVLAGGVAMFVVSRPLGIDDLGARLALGLVAVLALAFAILICWPLLVRRRLGATLAYVRRNDGFLLALTVILATTLACLMAFPIGPTIVQGVALVVFIGLHPIEFVMRLIHRLTTVALD